MEKIFVLKRDKFIKGPYTLEEIQLKGLKNTDKVWYEGIKDWTFATNIAEFKYIISTKSETSTSGNFLNRLFKR
jgi:hypothetical protein